MRIQQLNDSALEDLYKDRCPYCTNDLEWGHRFQQEDGRHGGLMTCPVCQIRIAWIDNPFESEVTLDE